MPALETTAPRHRYAMIVPCYNEENRFPFAHFLDFARKNPDVLLCFVNDGSKDKTLAVLRGIQVESPGNICLYSMKKNGGKAEAVRQGMLYVLHSFNTDLLGFLDADLATRPEEWLQMAKYRDLYPQFGSIIGSRIRRLGANINRNDQRSLLSAVVRFIIRLILGVSFQDTQCGAKIFHRHLVPFLFRDPFMTPWLFDVEIFMRLRNKFGKKALQTGVLEFPLMHWSEVGDSRLTLRHSIRIPKQLIGLYLHYHASGLFIAKSGYSVFDIKNSHPRLSRILGNLSRWLVGVSGPEGSKQSQDMQQPTIV
ncbi:glycosyltransferase [Spirosoma luteolum]